MKLSLAELLAWDVVADITTREAPEEKELLPDIVTSITLKPRAIGNTAIAFDGPEIVTLSTSIFFAIVPVLKAATPKLFDASLDVAKDYLKNRWSHAVSPAKGAATDNHNAQPIEGVTLNDIHKQVLEAAQRKGLSDRTCQAIADAVVSRLVID